MRGYPFQKIFYQLTHVEDFSGLFLFLAGLLLLIILIGIYFLIFKGLKHFVNKKIAGILSAVILITGTVTMYHYNRDYITEAYNIKEAGRGISVRKTHMPEMVHGKAPQFPKGSTAAKILEEINSAKTSEELEVVRTKMEANPELKKNEEALPALRKSVKAKKWEFDNAAANQKFKSEQAAREAEHAAIVAIEKPIADSLLRTNKPLTEEQIKYMRENPGNWKWGIEEHNKRFPDTPWDESGRPIRTEPPQPTPAPESASPTTEANPGESAESLSEEMLKGPAEPATEPEPQPVEPDTH